MPIWKPFMAWMAVWALEGLSKLTKPEGGSNRMKEIKHKHQPTAA